MKKSLILAALLIGAGSAQAQLTSKKGEAYLPAAGDWSIGIDATPFLTYLGGFLSGTGAVAPTQNFLNANQTIIGKYFKTDKMAYRGILRVGMNNQSYANSITQTGATATFPNLPAQVEDTYKEKSTNIGLGAGLEWRRGATRLQGYYGGDVMLSLVNSGRSYTYGNALTTTATVGAVSTDWSTVPGAGGTSNFSLDGSYRNTEVKDGSSFAFTLRGFAGVEYFVLPKISIAGEFGWGLTIASNAASSTSREGTDGVAIGSNTVEGSKTGSFSLDTDQNLTGTTTGALRLNFHF
jgi:hypothetical protein